MDELLTPVSTTYKATPKAPEPFLTEVKKSVPETSKDRRPVTGPVRSLDDAIQILKSQPEYDELVAVLRFLTGTREGDESTGKRLAPGPKSAAVVQLLVTDIASNYWPLLAEGSLDGGSEQGDKLSSDATLFNQCLRSITGLNALLSHIKAFTQEAKTQSKEHRRPDLLLNLRLLLDLLAAVLHGDHVIRDIWATSVAGCSGDVQVKGQMQGLVSALTSGRLQATVAEALQHVEQEDLQSASRWTGDGLEFTRWLGRNISSWVVDLPPGHGDFDVVSVLLQRGLSMGYQDALINVLIETLLLSSSSSPELFSTLCLRQPTLSRKVLHSLLKYLSNRFLNRLELKDTSSDPTVSASAGLLKSVVAGDRARRDVLVNWCCSTSGAGLGEGVGIRRAVLAVLGQDKESIASVFERSLAQFGDELYIKHTPILQQQVHAEVLLLSAGYLFRISPIKVTILLRSSTYLSTISNRIAATQTTARFLGMVVGESLSNLIDDKKKKLDFHMEETDSEEANWLKGLTKTSDDIGSHSKLQSEDEIHREKPQSSARAKAKKPPKAPPKATTMPPRGIIEEIDSDDEEDDLVPYAKASDPEDSDEDPTLVQRNKVRPPVYIRTLIEYLRDTESYDKQRLALQTAPALIRRKANYGTETSSHADELANLLAGIQDKFEIENYHDLRLQSIIALIVAQPKTMGPWFARTFFEGDYSLTQRTTVLVALGLAARELAGFKVSEYHDEASFPSKQLPQKMERLYLNAPSAPNAAKAQQNLKALPPTALHKIADSLTSSFLAPMAAEAADATSGPDALKLETFSARYKSKSRAQKPRVRAIPNTTAALLATSFFSPLTAHFTAALRSSRALILNPALLSLYLQTLGIVIHAAGPSTLSLPQLTSELWDLLLSVRVHAAEDLGAVRGWLIALAALLEVNEGDENMRRVCQEQGRAVVETREWVGGVFERTRGEDGGEENEVKMLAAGILIRISEAVERYQALLMGNLVGFP
ncbi:telomere length regulation protein [Sarocladium implicatum]|nr:telomere length regulation protein [Sarocladium implicatum]